LSLAAGGEGQEVLSFIQEEGRMKIKHVVVMLVFIVMAGACFKSKPKGGVRFTLQVMTNDAVDSFLDESLLRMRKLYKQENIVVGSWKRGQSGQLLAENCKSEDEFRIRDLAAQNFNYWKFTFEGRTASLILKAEIMRLIRNQAMDQTLEVLKNRLGEVGISNPLLERAPGDRIIVEVRGRVNIPDRILVILITRAVLELKLVQAGPAADEASLLKDYDGHVPEDMEVVRANPAKMEDGFFLVNRTASVTGSDLKSVHPDRDEWDMPAVLFVLKPEGARRFGQLTGENIGRRVAIILDGRVQSAPIVQARIEDHGVIQGRFTSDEVEDLILMLKSGALPAGVKVVEEKTF
jgi:preprotein translocase subunit SecD